VTDETNDAWMKPGPPNPWPILGWRLFGSVMVIPLWFLFGGLLPDAVLPLPEALILPLIYLGPALWLLSLVAFCYARFWRDPKPLWGHLVLAGPGWGRWALRVLASLLIVALGLPVYVLAFFIVIMPFNAGRW
jgi:hypothetical protein